MTAPQRLGAVGLDKTGQDSPNTATVSSASIRCGTVSRWVHRSHSGPAELVLRACVVPAYIVDTITAIAGERTARLSCALPPAAPLRDDGRQQVPSSEASRDAYGCVLQWYEAALVACPSSLGPSGKPRDASCQSALLTTSNCCAGALRRKASDHWWLTGQQSTAALHERARSLSSFRPP